MCAQLKKWWFPMSEKKCEHPPKDYRDVAPHYCISCQIEAELKKAKGIFGGDVK